MLKKKLPLSYIEISKKNLIHNVKHFRNLIKKGTKISVVIKGNAYGHGQNEVAKILEPYVDYFFVNSLEELKLLRKVSKRSVLLFGYVQKTDLIEIMKLGCTLAIFSIEQLRELNKTAQKLKTRQEIHIPFDAYLGREGFLLCDLPELFREIKKSKYIKFSGIYAHFANIEDTANFTHAQKQINEYKKALSLAYAYGFKNLETHISASSGTLIYEKNTGINSIVRLGLSIYGMWPSEYLKSTYKNSEFNLKPIMSWKTKIAQIKILPKGNTIGYGLTYKTKKTTKIAIIPQGYADGVDRGLSNKGEVLIKGARCEIIGRVSMNMFTVDISHLVNVKIEDEVVILGCQNKEEITAEEIANKLDTINYEITTRISSLLPRVIK
ncbi:alanine racemase [Candidatus Nomurabacteria bacterium RIFCSPHIGHO2_01_FULL_37_25]|uniref:Alanine racemase n=1 Tax=Candidatus Nomurabacteria bacterium RIFCSPLOWO2_01_FULL_36_16 TaxID=1801767 RepID=A0A1F6WZK2_9BACT|nr:MAG: alanine racemase [Candidatus Nomurabacteria bacterium RIFCSPHIGHO2_01_FULL_37_25]OGI75489.1 MAG: alanine racemase [Candidatus Nomurabacteria bacterium RIFCSPHIGHO2_02_FULL_36_29]OGI87327.1 MAG: alanine racemase [Candidatus Nomurabacteria bacterium RIFCSPLOWO2_01_FULL_36_16]OGI94876.1 MAG: alanine racemase [Candidatus Nomurabacteria bacterium RIFCSPLOWO2_02_FULL_36_8]